MSEAAPTASGYRGLHRLRCRAQRPGGAWLFYRFTAEISGEFHQVLLVAA